MKVKNIQTVNLNHTTAKTLFDDLTDNNLDVDQKKVLRGAVNLHIQLAEKLKDRSFKLKDIREMFGVDLQNNIQKGNGSDQFGSTSSDNDDGNNGPSTTKDVGKPDTVDIEGKSSKSSSKTGGRIPQQRYTGLTNIYLTSKYTLGQRCLECELGNLNRYDEMVLIRFDGNLGNKVQVEQFRCGACQQIFTADYSQYGEDKYSTLFKSKVVVDKYWSGMPFKRSETYYDMVGCPIPDATLWDLTTSISSILEPVYEEIIKYASDSDVISTDDTQARILERIQELKYSDDQRKGTFTTGFICTKLATGNPEVVLYMNGKNHMGENLAELLSLRSEPLSELTVMTDGLDSILPDLLDAVTCNCMSHGFRKFKDILSAFPTECHYIICELKKVFEFDATAKAFQMSPDSRLQYHQINSLPIMTGLKIWMQLQIDQNLVEPNSNLGKAIGYMLKRWVKLTRFCYVAGAPLDNNSVERMLKIAIRTRKNAMFYRTKSSARVAGIMMSVIETCRRNMINPIKYLTHLQDNVLAVIKNPKDYLPWKYIDGNTIPAFSN